MKLKTKITTIISFLIIILIALLSYNYKDKLYKFYNKLFYQEEITKITYNDYYKNNDYLYVQNTTDFRAKNNDHLKNIFYTIINSGVSSFTFYCNDNYKECLTDVEKLANDQTKLSNINNYVHPFNSFKKIYVTYSDKGKITVKIDKTYTDEEITELNSKVDNIIKEVINEDMNTNAKIRTIHDYIINNSNYANDEMIKDNPNIYNKATGNLLNKYGLCSGYADAMALFLERFEVNNYKIASTSHIWNLVKIDDEWLHLDLTWDDPIASDGKDHLEILFFLIDDNRLKELNVEQHDYDKNIYMETSLK